MKTYTKEEMKALVAEFSAEFDALVKAEVAKTGAALKKSEDGSDEKKDAPPADKSSEGSESAPAGGAEESGPPAPPAADASAAPAESAAPPAADPASASAPAADPAAQAAGTDPVSALVQAYGSLSPEELQFHIQALQQVVQSQGAGAAAPAAAPQMGAPAPAPAADPMAAAAPAAPAPAPAAAAPAAGPDAVAPLAGEGSKPVDPAATLALKSEMEKELSLIKSERDALKKSVEQLTDTLSKAVARPEVKSIAAEDIAVDLAKSETPKFVNMTKAEITKKLAEVARTDLKKSDRDLINKLYKGEVKVEALAHLLG